VSKPFARVFEKRRSTYTKRFFLCAQDTHMTYKEERIMIMDKEKTYQTDDLQKCSKSADRERTRRYRARTTDRTIEITKGDQSFAQRETDRTTRRVFCRVERRRWVHSR
jgi:hypothetical protein